jgi:hypothetical protein
MDRHGATDPGDAVQSEESDEIEMISKESGDLPAEFGVHGALPFRLELPVVRDVEVDLGPEATDRSLAQRGAGADSGFSTF